MFTIVFRMFLAVGLCIPAAALAAVSPDVQACDDAMSAFEHADHLPPKVLSAIGLVESGRKDPRTGVVGPWPWTINIGGQGMFFDSAASAIAAVRLAQGSGVRSIDVGCMQVNLAYHPHAFASLEEAFDQTANVRYAAAFLSRLHGQSGSWAAAIAAYHSADPALSGPYAQTIAAVWRLAPQYGLSTQRALAGTALEDEVDPGHVLTPEFRAQLMASMRFEREHGLPAGLSRPSLASKPTHFPPGSALAAEVDPNNTLTPEFRAAMISAAAFRRKTDRQFGILGVNPWP